MTDYSEDVEDILSLLREIRDRLPEKPKKKTPRKEPTPGNEFHFIKAYCEAFKARYGTNPHINGKSTGIAQDLLKRISLYQATALIQAYCQMEDKWFLMKCHDLVTFSQNLNKVAVALFNGTSDPHEKSYWAKVFGAQSAAASLPTADTPSCEELGRTQLQSGESGTPVEGVPKHER